MMNSTKNRNSSRQQGYQQASKVPPLTKRPFLARSCVQSLTHSKEAVIDLRVPSLRVSGGFADVEWARKSMPHKDPKSRLRNRA